LWLLSDPRRGINIMIYEQPRIKCPLCSKQSDLLATKGMTHHIICDNCGEYIITFPAERVLEVNNFEDRLYLLSSQTFESTYYDLEVLTVGAEQIEHPVDVSFHEKIYKLARYIYSETKRMGPGKKIEKIRPQSHYCRETSEYIYLLDALQSLGIITYEKIGGKNGDDRIMAMPPKLEGQAMLAFEEGIDNLDEFKKVFMSSISNKDGISINVNSASGSQFNVALQGSKIKATQNNNPSLSEINNLLDDLLSKIPVELSKEIKEQIKDSISVIKMELQNPTPNKGIIRTLLFGVKTLSNVTQFAAAIATILEVI
jgi:hypothetical protein